MTLVRLIISMIYTFAGMAACAAFVLLKNDPTAGLAFATGIINLLQSHLHLLNYKKKLEDWYAPKHLRQIGWLAFYCFAISCAVFVFYLVLEIIQKKPILPINESLILPLIWAFITLKSGLILCFFCWLYSRQSTSEAVDEETAPIQSNDLVEEITP